MVPLPERGHIPCSADTRLPPWGSDTSAMIPWLTENAVFIEALRQAHLSATQGLPAGSISLVPPAWCSSLTASLSEKQSFASSVPASTAPSSRPDSRSNPACYHHSQCCHSELSAPVSTIVAWQPPVSSGRVQRASHCRQRWSSTEDALLRQLVDSFGTDWTRIAMHFPHRTARLVKERWHAHLDPNIIRMRFSPEEDRRILEAVRLRGTSWSLIAELFPGRTPLMLKNRYNTQLLNRAD